MLTFHEPYRMHNLGRAIFRERQHIRYERECRRHVSGTALLLADHYDVPDRLHSVPHVGERV